MFSSPPTPPPPDPPASFGYKCKVLFGGHWRGMACIIIPLACLGLLHPFPPMKYQCSSYCLVVMALFWVTECIPLPVTGFIPIIIFPLTGIMTTSRVCQCYINDTIIMFLGSLMLAYAVEQSGLHSRMALCAIRLIGYSHYKLLFAMCCITTFVSMWITNTAATTMMVPINFAILQVFVDQGLMTFYETTATGDEVASPLTVCYFCAATFSATVGGIGTLVGTGTNLVFRGLFMARYPTAPDYLSFPLFSVFAIPYMICMEIFVYLYLILVYFGFLRPKSTAAERVQIPDEVLDAVKEKVNEDWRALGRMTYWEINVALLFSLGIALFFSRSPQIFQGWADVIVKLCNIKEKKFIRDSAAAIFVAFLMFLFPSNMSICKNFFTKYKKDMPTKDSPQVLNWELLNSKMPYSFMFLLGGGVALSDGGKPEYSNLNGELGKLLIKLKPLPNYVILLILIICTVFLTNFASNVAICNIVTPIGLELASQIEQNPLWYTIATGYSASYCFCLPVGTPGNLIVSGAAKVTTGQMFVAGIGPSITTILWSWAFMSFYAPVIWPDLKIGHPTWAIGK